MAMAMKLPILSLKPSNIRAYAADSGVDIHVPKGTKAYAAMSGRIIYSEYGHTPWGTVWNRGVDTPGCILIQFDEPFMYKDKAYFYMWYAHMDYLVYKVRDGIDTPIHVSQGIWLGKTGTGNKVDHLHFGILSRRGQQDGDFIEPLELQRYLKGLLKKGGEQK